MTPLTKQKAFPKKNRDSDALNKAETIQVDMNNSNAPLIKQKMFTKISDTNAFNKTKAVSKKYAIENLNKGKAFCKKFAIVTP